MSQLSAELIERRAQQVLRSASALTIPVDLEKVLASLNVRVHDEDMDDETAGVLIVKGEQRHILVNKDHPMNRKRFTIAHELGHLVLHDDEANGDALGQRMFIDRQIRVYQRVGEASSAVYQQEGSLTTIQQEREANAFAACLLMPAPHVTRAALERDLFDEISVASLARHFGVSEQAMSIRLQQLQVLTVDSGLHA
ncbi:ImmA/IrrE family metallo-endopeptidase [Roseateles microcysteis]|uniref:ImmA/IrrE family metallo-endopeptidase n=1 Tax=Roseateles microcysteis TaxID=3119057 RepID=UPI002FE582AA